MSISDKVASDVKQNEVSSSLSSHDDKKQYTSKEKKADFTLSFMEQHDSEVGELSPEGDKKLFRKLLVHVLIIVTMINMMMFFDKNAMGYSKLLGLWDDTNLTQAEYNNTNSLFYAGYLIGQIPGHILFQRCNTRYFMTAVISIWTLLMFVQLEVKSYKDIAAIRFFLGLTESVVTPCIEHTLAMFFTLREQAIINPIFWIGTVGVGIPTGFMSYGISHYQGSISQWKLYWIVNGGLTFCLAIWVFFKYPDSPATFKSFTVEERVHIIRRIKQQSRSSISERHFKKEQMYETLKDPVSYLFALFAFCSMLPNNMNFQQQVIYTSLGVTRINANLITVVQAAYSAVTFVIGSFAMSKWKNSLCYLSIIFLLPSILGGFLAVCLPYSEKIGILASCIIIHTFGFAYILGLCWSQASAAGYTKRILRTALFMIGYGVSNIVAPQMWTEGPRYYDAWIVQLVLGWFGSGGVLLTIRFILSRRNKKRRENLKFDSDGNVISTEVAYIEDPNEEGGKKKVDISMLDLTDIQNKEFLYPL